MTTTWQRKRIGDLADHSLGKMLDKAKNRGEPHPYLRNLNVRWFGFDLSDLLEMRFTADEADKYSARKDDVLVCEGGYPGRAAIWDRDEPVYFQKALHRVRFHQPEHSKWLVYYLHWKDLEDTLSSHFTGAGIQHFTREALARFELPIPPVREIKRIVEILDAAFDAISSAETKAERNLRHAEALLPTYLDAEFMGRGKNWLVHKVSKIADHSLGKMLDKVKNKGNPQPYLRNVNVRWFGFDLSDMFEMRFLPEENGRYTAVRGDVLVCEGGHPGRCAIWNEDYPIHFQKALHRVRFRQPEHNKWFVYYMFMKHSRGELKKYFTGTGIQHFTGEALSNFEIPVAPLPIVKQLVQRFDSLLDETERLTSLYRRKLAALDELKQSILHQAFTGQL